MDRIDDKTFAAVKKPWGGCTLFVDNAPCSVKILEISEQFSLQSHKLREEIWYVVSGEVLVYKGPVRGTLEEIRESLQEIPLKADEYVFIPKGSAHSMKNLGEKPALVLEILQGNYQEDDIIRYDDIYGRMDNGK